MKTLTILLLSTFLVSTQLHGQVLSGSASGRVFVDTVCDISFEYPASWTLQHVKDPFFRAQCSFGLKTPDWDSTRAKDEFDMSECSIYISIYEGALDSTAEDYGLAYQDSTWWIEGRAGARNEAVPIHSLHWIGIRGKSEVGLYKKNNGGYFGAQTTFVAYLDNRKGRLVGIVASSSFDNALLFDSVVNSIRF